MERETTKIITPIQKKEVVLKSWLIASEKLSMAKVGNDDFIEWMINNIIISPNLNEIKTFHGKDFDFILREMRKVIDASTWKDEKKELNGSTKI